MTDEERAQVNSLLDAHGPDNFMKAYLKVHPRQADRINAVIKQRGVPAAVAMLFNYIPKNPDRRRLPGNVTPMQPTAQGIGREPTQTLGVGASPTVPVGPGAGTTEALSQEIGRAPGSSGVQAPPLGPPEAERASLAPSGRPAPPVGQTPASVTEPAPVAPGVPLADPYDLFDSLVLMTKSSGVPISVLMGMMKQESQFDPSATSAKGAKGLMQLMADAARDRGLTVDASTDERLDPMRNIQAGLSQMEWLKDNYAPRNLQSWLAAYNAGHRRLKNEMWKNMKEPRDYANKVTAFAEAYEADPQLMVQDFLKLYQNIKGVR